MSKQDDILEREGYLESFDPELKRAFDFAEEKVDPSIVDRSKVKIEKDNVLLSGDGTFYTLQGEGPTMGLPCVFVRLHVCNLRCVWCDAWYTWNPNTEEYWTEPQRVSFEECADRIKSTWACNDSRTSRRVIFTGGEPLIQRRQLDKVYTKLNGPYYRGEVDYKWIAEAETNGTLMPTELQLEEWQFNCSPKLKNSENHYYSMVKPKIISALNSANTTFKFVVTAESDLDEIEEKYGPYVDHDKIIIMPQGVTADEVDMNAQKVAEKCKQKGYRLLGRLQNNIWGAKRGV